MEGIGKQIASEHFKGYLRKHMDNAPAVEY
jgi:hypothetical protein